VQSEIFQAFVFVNVVKFHKKKQHFEQKAEKIVFLSKTTSGSDSEQ